MYVDSDTCQYYVNTFDFKLSPESISRNIDGFLSNDVCTRMAMFHVYYHGEEWLSKFQQIYDHCDHIFVFCTELHAHTVEALKSIDLPRVSIYACGFINEYTFQHAQIKQYMDWFWTTGYFYTRSQPTFLRDKIGPPTSKIKYFDIIIYFDSNATH